MRRGVRSATRDTWSRSIRSLVSWGLHRNSPAFTRRTPPRNVGGNLDCKLATAGSTIYLPVMCEGAYFYVGDGHAVQGDGELGGTAIECTLDKVDLTFRVVHETIRNPILRTQSAWVTFGFDTDLTNAAYEALTEMANLIGKLYDMTFQEALAMAKPCCRRACDADRQRRARRACDSAGRSNQQKGLI